VNHEIVVEGFVLQVEVTHCINEPARPGTRDSDWEAQGCRELEFKLVSGICYDEDAVRMDVPEYQLPVLAHQYGPQITLALWFEIDALKRRQRRAA
jgi:hypothetical protein